MVRKSRKQILNPIATPFLCNSQEEAENQIKAETWSTITSNNLNNDWVTTERVFQCYRSGSNISASRHENMRNILLELVEEEMNYKEREKEEMCVNEVHKKEI